jgi:hypothetical protein
MDSVCRNFRRDAKCSKMESGTANAGIITSGNWVMSSLGASNAKICRGEGEVRKPIVIATVRSAIPGPVFVHETACVRYDEDAGYPAGLREFGAVLDA